MTDRIILTLGGKLRSGKDTVADHLVANHGFVKLGMSDALHEAMMRLDPVLAVSTRSDFYETKPIRYSDAIDRYGYVNTKEIYPEARRLLQKLGTEVGREMFDPNVWVDITKRTITDYLATGRNRVVLTGIRFPNELAIANHFAGTSVWVDRPGLDSAGAAAHASENSVDGSMFDRTITNDGTLEDLYAAVDRLMEDYTL